MKHENSAKYRDLVKAVLLFVGFYVMFQIKPPEGLAQFRWFSNFHYHRFGFAHLMLPLVLLTIQSVMNVVQEPNLTSPICRNMHTRKGGISKVQPPFYWRGGYGCLALVAPPTMTLFMLTERVMQFAMMLFTKKTLSDTIDFKAIHE